MSLEVEENPVETPPPTPETPPAAPEPPQQAAPAPDPDPDGTIEGSGGVKFVPLGAVVDLRGKVREKDTVIASKDTELAAAKAELEQVRGAWNTVQPLIQQIRQQQAQPSAPAKPQVNEAALNYAKYLDLYKPDGTPDVERAQRVLDLNAAQAQEVARAAVQPLYQSTAQQQSAANYTAAANYTDKNGIKVDQAILQDIWNKVPKEMSANPDIAALLYKVAKAETLDAGKWKPQTPAPPPPIVTESLGGGASVPKELTYQDKQMMSAANIKPSDYEKISSNFKPGQANSLE